MKMTRALVALAFGLAVAVGGSVDLSFGLGAPAEATPIAAVVLDPKDVRQSVLLGPSGQLYEPAAASSPASATPAPAPTTPAASAAPLAPSGPQPRWVRRSAGGVSSTLAGAARLDDEIYAAGTQTPLFRRAISPSGAPSSASSSAADAQARQWKVSRLGQRGRVVFGTGPFFSLSIGRQIFIRVQGRFVRIGTAPAAVVALWASSETAVAFATEQGVFRRRGAAFVLTTKVPGVLGFSGAAPHALTVDTAINLRTGARVRLPGQMLRAVRSESAPSAIVRPPAGSLVLARDLTAPASHISLPPSAGSAVVSDDPPAFAAVDAAGRALISSSDSVLVYDGTTWQPAALADELPAARPGPAAARSR